MAIELRKEFLDEAEMTRFSEEISEYIIATLEAAHDYAGRAFTYADETAVREVIARYDSLSEPRFREIMAGVVDTLANYAYHAGASEPELEAIQPCLYALAEKLCNRVSEGKFREIIAGLREDSEKRLHR